MDLYNFLNLIWDQINKGIYVWGGDGEILSEMSDPIAWIERHETSAKDAKRAVTLSKSVSPQGSRRFAHSIVRGLCIGRCIRSACKNLMYQAAACTLFAHRSKNKTSATAISFFITTARGSCMSGFTSETGK